ncbi:MAG: AbrB family transcriptional regulator [Bilophila wadsworthia]
MLCGAAGGFIFEWFGLPGGAMTGAIIAVILLKSFSSLPQAAFPRPFQFVFMLALACWSATCTGRNAAGGPGHVARTGDQHLLVLVAGMLIAIFVVKFGNLDVTSAYLATSPGGLNVVVGLAADIAPTLPSCSPIKWSGFTPSSLRFPSPPGFCTNS